MQSLIILGAGPHAQEMADIVAQINGRQPTWQLEGFLVPAAEAGRVGQVTGSGMPVLGTYADLTDYPDAVFAMEYGCGRPPVARERVVSLVASSAFVAYTARIGAGCVIYPGCFVGHNAVLGDRVFVLSGAVINHDCHLEDEVTVCTNVSLAGHVYVARGAYLGQACTIRQHLRIGQESLVGMGSVVVKDVAPHAVVMGNPARERDTERRRPGN
ncbi:MAG: hypothetical protein JXC32_10520 [Anaerolineae bacterium]|nr:hypothetical protein [Anaerolineae bacterium]